MFYSVQLRKKQNKSSTSHEGLENIVPNGDDWILDERHFVVSPNLRQVIFDLCDPTDIMDCFTSKNETAYHIRLYDTSISQNILTNLQRRRGDNPKNEFVYTAWTKWCNSTFEKNRKCLRERCTFIHLNEKAQIGMEGNIWNESKKSLNEFLKLRSKQGLTNKFIRRDFPQWINSVSKNKSNNSNKQRNDNRASTDNKMPKQRSDYPHTCLKCAAATVKKDKTKSMNVQEVTWQVKKKGDYRGDARDAINDFPGLLDKRHNLVINLNMELKCDHSHCIAKSSKNKDLEENTGSTSKEEEEKEKEEVETQFSDETGKETITTSESLTDGTDGNSLIKTPTIINQFEESLDLSDSAKLATPSLMSCASTVSPQSQIQTPVQIATHNQIVLNPSLQSIEQLVNTCMNSCDGLSSFAVHGCSDMKNNCFRTECIMTGDVLKNFIETGPCVWEGLPKPHSFNDSDLCPEFTKHHYCPQGMACLWRHYYCAQDNGFDEFTQYIAITLINRYRQENTPSYHSNLQYHSLDSFAQQSITPMSLTSLYFPFTDNVQKELLWKNNNTSSGLFPFIAVENYGFTSNIPNMTEHGCFQNQAAYVDWEKLKKDQFETCWDFNTSAGCPRGSSCRWKHQTFVMNELSNDFSQFNDGSRDSAFLKHPVKIDTVYENQQQEILKEEKSIL